MSRLRLVAALAAVCIATPVPAQVTGFARPVTLSLKYTSVGTTEDEHAVKTTAGILWSITGTNTNAAARYLRCENDTAANTTPGSETPELDLALPGGGGFAIALPNGFIFATALTCWLVTGAADTDVAEVAANEIKLLYTYN